MGRNRVESVTQGDWSVGSVSGHGIAGAILQVSRRERKAGLGWMRHLRGDHDGRAFSSSDAAHAFALSHGYSQVYYRRAMPAAWRSPERERIEQARLARARERARRRALT